MNSRTQASIEYVMVNAIGIAILGIVVAAGINLFEAGMFALDAQSGKMFVDELSETVNKLNFLGDESSFVLEAYALNDWLLEIDGRKISLEIKGSKNLNKNFERELGNLKVENKNLKFEGNQNQKVIVKKTGGKIFVDMIQKSVVSND